LWAAIVWIWQMMKTFRIRREIRKTIASKHGVAGSLKFFGISLKNNSPWPVIIRSAGFSCSGDISFVLQYRGTKSPVYGDHILLKTVTGDIWWLPIEMLKREIIGIWVGYEFDTVFGRSKVEKIELGGGVADFF
jgi:hypothetical protein